jgi:glycosyltransferase involved in cell wall biosynthesis
VKVALLLWPDTFEDWYGPLGLDRGRYLAEYDSEWSITFARMLHEACAEVHLVFCTLHEPAVEVHAPSGAVVHFVRASPAYRGLRRAVWGHRWWKPASRVWPLAPLASTASPALLRAIRRIGADVCVVQDYESLRFDIAAPALRAVGQRIVAIDAGGSSAPRRGSLHRWSARQAHRLLAVNAAEAVRARNELRHPDVETWPVPVRDGTFVPQDRRAARAALGVADDARLVVSVGRLHPVKNLHDLVDACRGLDGVDLVLAGAGPERESLDARARDGRLRLLGWVSNEDAALWYAAADVVALSSTQEGQPTTVLEAFACGRGVVATAVGGVPEVVRPGDTGWLVPPRDVSRLRSALAEAVADPDEADRRGRNGRALVLGRHAFSAASREMLRLLDV